MTDAPDTFKAEMLVLLPSLRAFARSLARNPDTADDLVQETMIRAWERFESYTPGTNMRAWLFTILRNNFYSMHRKRRREVEDVDDVHAGRLSTMASQLHHIEVEEFKAALGEINAEQREALILIGVEGYSYEEAAEICDCAIGTVKSRVNRARVALSKKLELETVEALPRRVLEVR